MLVKKPAYRVAIVDGSWVPEYLLRCWRSESFPSRRNLPLASARRDRLVLWARMPNDLELTNTCSKGVHIAMQGRMSAAGTCCWQSRGGAVVISTTAQPGEWINTVPAPKRILTMSTLTNTLSPIGDLATDSDGCCAQACCMTSSFRRNRFVTTFQAKQQLCSDDWNLLMSVGIF